MTQSAVVCTVVLQLTAYITVDSGDDINVTLHIIRGTLREIDRQAILGDVAKSSSALYAAAIRS